MANPVAVITFHHFHPAPGRLSVPPDLLETVLRALKQRYTFIAWEQFKEYLAGRRAAPRGCVLATFDDGYLDQYLHGFPVFQRLDVPFVVFLVTGFIREQTRCRTALERVDHKAIWRDPHPDYFLNTAELRMMNASGLAGFGSHSESHLHCRGKTEALLREEFNRSHAAIRSLNLERSPHGFCWPQGAYDSLALEVIRDSPYRFAFSTFEGGFRPGDDPFTIRRIDCSSFSGDNRDYTSRLRRKLWIYTSGVFGHWYSAFKNYRESCLNRGRIRKRNEVREHGRG